MTRFRSLAIALTALALSAGAAFAFTAMPDPAVDALEAASQHADRALPARPVALPIPADTHVSDGAIEPTAADLPDAASHGAAVSEAAKPDDPPAGSDHGAAVREVARDNHGTATAAEHTPADAGKPADAGRPEDPGPPSTVELPAAAPEDPGPPADPGKPDDPGRPD
jgi:hypothetical protein